MATNARYSKIACKQFTANLPRNLPVKIFVNRLRFDRIMLISLCSHFLRHPVDLKCVYIGARWCRQVALWCWWPLSRCCRWYQRWTVGYTVACFSPLWIVGYISPRRRACVLPVFLIYFYFYFYLFLSDQLSQHLPVLLLLLLKFVELDDDVALLLSVAGLVMGPHVTSESEIGRTDSVALHRGPVFGFVAARRSSELVIQPFTKLLRPLSQTVLHIPLSLARASRSLGLMLHLSRFAFYRPASQQICTICRSMAADEPSRVSFSIIQVTLPWQPVLWAKPIHYPRHRVREISACDEKCNCCAGRMQTNYLIRWTRTNQLAD